MPREKDKDKINEAAETAPEETCSDANEAETPDLEIELAKEKDNFLRLAAEYDNFRKRSLREREAILAEALSMSVSAFLPLIDNLERACAAANAPEATVDGMREGLDLIFKQLDGISEKLGLEAIDPAGQPFDPVMHDAVMHVEDENFGESTVAEVLQKGYRIGDRVIRHAMVKVAN